MQKLDNKARKSHTYKKYINETQIKSFHAFKPNIKVTR